MHNSRSSSTARERSNPEFLKAGPVVRGAKAEDQPRGRQRTEKPNKTRHAGRFRLDGGGPNESDAGISRFQDGVGSASFDENLLGKSFRNFLNKIICPFCLKHQNDKDNLIKHLDESCSMKRKNRYEMFAFFQIHPDNNIKCSICPNSVMRTAVGYFMHLHSGNHISNHLKAVNGSGRKLADLMFCSSCKVFVINSYTQFQFHIQHGIHNARRKSTFKSDHFLDRGIQCIYCFYNGNKRFRCLLCPSPNFLFKTPLEIVNHLENSKHFKNDRNNYLSAAVYCCFCDEEVNRFEMHLHFASEEHAERANAATAEKDYELCLFCGLACNTLQDLFIHMKLNCREINEIRKKKNENDLMEKERKITRKLNKNRSVLIKKNVNQKKLLQVLKKFGDITYWDKFDDENLIVEFKKETAVELILLVQSFIKVYNKVNTSSKRVEGNKSRKAQASASGSKDL